MKELKNIVGAVKSGEPATIRFYGEVNEWNCTYFNYEMMWLIDQKPSKINIMINSEGGSVIHGMGTYSVIQDCPIETECIIDGLAASMGSVIWAAGDTRKMRDYSILMMHNPFYSGGDDNSEDKALQAFTAQLQTVYKNKFGLSEETIKSIMDGKDGEDGTWLDHQSAVKYGIVEKDDVIKSAKNKCKKMKGLLSASVSVKDIVANVTKELIDEQPHTEKSPTIKAEENKTLNKQKMVNLQAIASLIGLDTEATQEDVFAALPGLMKAKGEVDSLKASLAAETKAKQDLEIKLAGEVAKATKANESLQVAEAALKTYKDKEAADLKASIESTIDTAIDEGRIPAETKAMWVSQAEANLDLVKQTLASIPAREKISEKLSKDDKQTKDASNTADEKMKAAVANAVGSDFKFKSLN